VSLQHAPLLYVFFEAHDMERERSFFERTLCLPILEIEPHLPHHRHGVVKYDAGRIILSLNLAGPGNFSPDTSDGLITVFAGSPEPEILRSDPCVASVNEQGTVTDIHGHHFGFAARDDQRGLAVRELRLVVADLAASTRFYRDIAGLEALEQTTTTARFATATVDLVLTQSQLAPDGRRPRNDTYLLVFYTPQVEAERTALLERGVEFKGSRVAHSEIGATARFEDPSGHRICIYEPSEECLGWASGPKVTELMELAASGTSTK
jgi:catechol 2,3-dioxygenase-like lactoylglutathione lyase family enzyme